MDPAAAAAVAQQQQYRQQFMQQQQQQQHLRNGGAADDDGGAEGQDYLDITVRNFGRQFLFGCICASVSFPAKKVYTRKAPNLVTNPLLLGKGNEEIPS